MRIGYADPPYVGCAHLYADQPTYAGEVDHAALVARLEAEFDGWVLHAAATPASMSMLAPLVAKTGARWMAWVKGFAAFKRNVSVAYAWEPVIVKAARKPVVSKRLVMRDWIECPITLKRGLTGAKPEAVCLWAFEMVGARPDDELVDLFPGHRSRDGGVGYMGQEVPTAGRREASMNSLVTAPQPRPGAALEDGMGLNWQLKRLRVRRDQGTLDFRAVRGQLTFRAWNTVHGASWMAWVERHGDVVAFRDYGPRDGGKARKFCEDYANASPAERRKLRRRTRA